VQDKDDSKTSISFGEFVSSMWIEHQLLVQTADKLPNSKRAVIETAKLKKGQGSDSEEDSILVPPSLAKYDFNP
jgi:hypothetical protein